MGFIGGNLEHIETTASRLEASGTHAMSTGTDAHAAAIVLSEAIDDAMSRLISTFEGVAESLTAEIAQSHSVLAASDWRGQSRENALVLKERLQGQVNAVLASATGNLALEKSTFVARSQSLVDSLHMEFRRVMQEIDGEYSQLAAASRRTRDNLALADQTILMS